MAPQEMEAEEERREERRYLYMREAFDGGFDVEGYLDPERGARLETLRGDPGAPAALLDWGFPISGKALRRIAGDAEITPILLSGKGDPLHVGSRPPGPQVCRGPAPPVGSRRRAPCGTAGRIRGRRWVDPPNPLR
jgi:hypothetical protein